MKDTLHFKYQVKLHPDCNKTEDGNFIIMIDGRKKVIILPKFEFYTYEQLTRIEVEDRIKGTKYVSIYGDFKEISTSHNVLEVTNVQHVKYSKEVLDFIEANSHIEFDSSGVKTYKLNKKYIVW